MFKRRLLLSVVAVSTYAEVAQAAVPASLVCDESKKVDCFRDEIFILDGSFVVEKPATGSDGVTLTPLVGGCKLDTVAGKPKPICTELAYPEAALVVANKLIVGGLAKTQWDTMSIFGADFPAEKRVDGSGGGIGPVLFRPDKTNDVDGIGLSLVKRGTFPFIGYIAAGSSTNFGTFVVPNLPPPAGLAKWPEPDPAGVPGYAESYPECDQDAMCFSGFHNGYQALATAVGQVFGPYINKANDDRILRPLQSKGLPFPEVLPQRQGLSQSPGLKPSIASTGARIWNSLLSFDASLMGGNRWRTNGNGLAETTYPSEHWTASPPYLGQPLSRFHPLELYLMGLAPSTELKPIADYTNTEGVEVQTQRLIEIFGSALTGVILKFGQLPNVSLAVKAANFDGSKKFTDDDRILDPVLSIVAANGERNPDFSEASHNHRMLWVVVTKPNDPEKTEEQIQYMLRWRRAWNAYYYMLTSYRGRMITTADTTEDDSPYWEFAQPIDEEKTFVPAGGLQIEFPGSSPTPGSPIIASFAHVVQTPGATGSLTFTPHSNQLPVRIKGDQQHPGAINSFAARLRLPLDGPKQSAALMQLEGGVSIRVPSDPGSFLIADGTFHTYSADLTKVPGYAGNDFTGFTFVPSTEPSFDVDIEFIRFANVKLEDLGDRDASCAGVPKPDGFINTEDNCPNQYNPLQEDADGNGVGDACEDYDADGTPNLCDNCPTLTNTRQRDRDDDGLGDACDESPGGGCFLQPESVAGGSPRGVAVGLLFLGACLARVIRKRRRPSR